MHVSAELISRLAVDLLTGAAHVTAGRGETLRKQQLLAALAAPAAAVPEAGRIVSLSSDTIPRGVEVFETIPAVADLAITSMAARDSVMHLMRQQ